MNKSWDDNLRLLLTNKRFLVALGVLFGLWSFKEGWWDIPLLREVVSQTVTLFRGLGGG